MPLSNSTKDIVLSPLHAVKELRNRAQNPELRRRVEEYLGNDIPEYAQQGLFLCATRYIVSANFETLRFLNLSEPLSLPVVLTEDVQDIFIPQNVVKKALCKLPIHKRITNNAGILHEQYEYKSIVDINTMQGRPFRDIQTYWGESLTSFHHRILESTLRRRVSIYDDAEWINRNGRRDPLALYKRFLALFLVHGVYFEDYSMKDQDEVSFYEGVVLPAFNFVTEFFGVTPLIARLVPDKGESEVFWNSYPNSILEAIPSRTIDTPRHPREADILSA